MRRAGTSLCELVSDPSRITRYTLELVEWCDAGSGWHQRRSGAIEILVVCWTTQIKSAIVVWELGGGRFADTMSKVVHLSEFHQRPKQVSFGRHELNKLFPLYSRRVRAGEWKDYAIRHGDGLAAFSVFRNTSDEPLYTIIKYAPGTHRSGDYMLCSGRRRIKRGTTLSVVLSSFDQPLKLIMS